MWPLIGDRPSGGTARRRIFSDREKIRKYLESIAVDGIVHEISNTTLVAMSWHVN